MRYVIFGAGAIGGTIAAALQLRDRHVILIARNLHLQALQQRGLTFIVPGQTHALSVTAVAEPADIQITSDDVVVLAVKSQQTATALTALRAATTGEPAIVCAQNGVENERQALRLFSRVYGMEVVMPATHLEPGIVEAHYRDVYGLLDFGRFPSAVSWPPNSATAPVTANSPGADRAPPDAHAAHIAADLRSAGFACEVRTRIMPWKYRKLVLNLGNGLQMLIGNAAESRDIVRMLRGEAAAVFAAADVEVTAADDYRKRTDLLNRSISDAHRRGGSSTWQSLIRGTGNVETDYLNGEIVLLGRLHGVPAPVNALIQELCRDHAARRLPPGGHSPAQLLSRARGLAQAALQRA